MLILPEPINRLSIFSSNLVIGSLAELQINLSDTSGLQAIDLILSYDDSIFSIPTSSAVYTSTTLTSDWTFLLNTNIPGQINISGFGISPLGTNSGALLQLNLNVKNEVIPATTTFELISASLNEDTIAVSLENLTVQTNYGSPHNLFLSSSSFSKNIVSGSTVATISTSDLTPGDTFTYSLAIGDGDADNGKFSIDGDQLKINQIPDYETKSSYSVRIQTKDSSGLSLEKVFTLNINGITELPFLKSIHAIKAKKKVRTFSLNKPLKIKGQELDAVIIGTKKKDRITGTSKNEILAGFKGKDVLKGGGGADGFLFDKPVGFGKKQMDKILDFDSEDLDKFLVDRKAFGLGRKVKFKAVSRKSQLKKASRTKVDFIYENKTGLLYFNENGKKSGFGDGGLFAQLQGKPELFADDFRIV